MRTMRTMRMASTMSTVAGRWARTSRLIGQRCGAMDMAKLDHLVALRALGHRKMPQPVDVSCAIHVMVHYPRTAGIAPPGHVCQRGQGRLQGTARISRLAEDFDAAQDVLVPQPPHQAQPRVHIGRAPLCTHGGHEKSGKKDCCILSFARATNFRQREI